MFKLKDLAIASCSVLVLVGAGAASAVTPANSAAFYQVALQAQYWKAAGNNAMALLTCTQYLTVQLPEPNDASVPSDRLFLKNQCTAAVGGGGGSGARGPWGNGTINPFIPTTRVPLGGFGIRW